MDKLQVKAQAKKKQKSEESHVVGEKYEKWCDKRKLKVDFNCVTAFE